MSGDHLGSLVPIVLAIIFIVSAVRRQFAKIAKAAGPAPAPQAAPAAQGVPMGQPVAVGQPVAPLARRRLAPVAMPAPARPTAPARPPKPPLPVELDAFPNLDLSLGDALPATLGAVPARRGTVAAVLAPGWAKNAIVAMEILGPPVSLRGGATLGAPHAF